MVKTGICATRWKASKCWCFQLVGDYWHAIRAGVGSNTVLVRTILNCIAGDMCMQINQLLHIKSMLQCRRCVGHEAQLPDLLRRILVLVVSSFVPSPLVPTPVPIPIQTWPKNQCSTPPQVEKMKVIAEKSKHTVLIGLACRQILFHLPANWPIRLVLYPSSRTSYIEPL